MISDPSAKEYYIKYVSIKLKNFALVILRGLYEAILYNIINRRKENSWKMECAVHDDDHHYIEDLHLTLRVKRILGICYVVQYYIEYRYAIIIGN